MEREVKRIRRGGYFGEVALITKQPRACSAFALGEVKLAVLNVEAFERLLGPCLDVMRRRLDDYEEELKRLFGVDVRPELLQLRGKVV